jgi:alanine dehydrogenase
VTLILQGADVRRTLDITGAIQAMEDLCKEEADNQTLSADRIHIRLPRAFLRILPGVLLRSGVLGYKEFHGGSSGMRYSIHLFDLASGEPLAMLDAGYVTALRTGAMAGIALKYLAPPNAKRVGVIGSGMEARSEMAALMTVRPDIRSGRVFSPNPDHRAAFARDMSNSYNIELEAVATARDAIDEAEVLLCATGGATELALRGEWLHSGLHINSIGSTAPEQREIAPDVWRAAHRIALDTRRLLHESGDAIAAAAESAIDESKIVELNQIVAGLVPGRTDAQQVTLYKSVGTGLQDIAAAYWIYQAAKAMGLGSDVADFVTPRRGASRPPAAAASS